MNLLLLRAHEVDADGHAFLPACDRRCRHLRQVLKVGPGQTLRAGVVDGPLGAARIEEVGDAGVRLACTFDPAPLPAPTDVLVLAVPRPKVLLRCVETAAALGFAKILLVRTWRTDKSHVLASAMALPALHAHAILGLEQARRTRSPQIEVHDRFRPFVEDQLDAGCGPSVRILADPDADLDLADALAVATPGTGLEGLPQRALALAIGPERGFTDFERELLASRGFVACHAGRHPLRVETALAWVYAQMHLLGARAGG
ncbi:MAG: RsmE family RNA methyltransferase [Planctomycetota bacterium]